MSHAIVLLSHGSRDPLWREPIEAVARQITALHPHRPVLCAYLELCTPTLAEATAALLERGAGELTVVPMFLGTGKHTRNDLPVLIETLQSTYPHLKIHLQSAIGEHPQMTLLMAEIASQIH